MCMPSYCKIESVATIANLIGLHPRISECIEDALGPGRGRRQLRSSDEFIEEDQ